MDNSITNNSNDDLSISKIKVAILLLPLLLPFLPGIGGSFFADDFLYTIFEPHKKIFHYFYSVNPGKFNYRPFQASFHAMLQLFWGFNVTWPLHLLHLFFHFGLALLVAQLTIMLGFCRVSALVASVFLITNQSSVSCIIGNDTSAQLLGVFFGAISMYYLIKFYKIPEKRNANYSLAIFSFMISLFMKESSASFLLISVIIIFWENLRISFSIKSLRKSFLEIFPFLIGFAIYYWLRSLVVQNVVRSIQSDNRYSIELGWNIPVNIGKIIGSMLSPISTPTVFNSFFNDNYLIIIFFIISFLGICVALAIGLLKIKKLNVLYLQVILLASFFPIVIIMHVSELYSYNSLILMSIIVSRTPAPSRRSRFCGPRRAALRVLRRSSAPARRNRRREPARVPRSPSPWRETIRRAG